MRQIGKGKHSGVHHRTSRIVVINILEYIGEHIQRNTREIVGDMPKQLDKTAVYNTLTGLVYRRAKW